MVLDSGVILRVRRISVESSAKMMKKLMGSGECTRSKKQKDKVMKKYECDTAAENIAIDVESESEAAKKDV